MTQGEKLIWASMFATSLHDQMGSQGSIHPKVLIAARKAYRAVKLVRQEVDNIEEATHISVANMMWEMMEDEPQGQGLVCVKCGQHPAKATIVTEDGKGQKIFYCSKCYQSAYPDRIRGQPPKG